MSGSDAPPFQAILAAKGLLCPPGPEPRLRAAARWGEMLQAFLDVGWQANCQHGSMLWAYSMRISSKLGTVLPPARSVDQTPADTWTGSAFSGLERADVIDQVQLRGRHSGLAQHAVHLTAMVGLVVDQINHGKAWIRSGRHGMTYLETNQ